MRKLIRGGAVLAVLVVVIVLAVSVLAPGESSLARAAQRLDGQNVRTQFDLDVVQDGQNVAVSGSGVVSADGTRSRLEMRLKSPDAKEPTELTTLTVDGERWITSERLSDVLPSGKRWVHAARDSSTPNAMTMSEFASFLRGADDVEDLGGTDIRGRRAVHYRGQISVRELAEETGGETVKRFEQALGEDAMLPIEAWIDERGRPLRIEINLRAGDAMLTTSADILEYGVAVDVEPPPAAQTVEESELSAG